MILSGRDIKEAVSNGDIIIKDFDPSKLEVNGYKLTLSKFILVPNEDSFKLVLNNKTLKYERVWDTAEEISYVLVQIPKEGLILQKGVLYLCCTNEYIGSDKYIPCIKDASSIARNGIDLRKGAGFGDLGFKGYWTLEVTVDYNTIVYADMPIGQMIFNEASENIDAFYGEKGNYQNQSEDTPGYPVPTKLFKKIK